MSILFRNKLFVVGYVLLGMLFSTYTALAQKEAEKVKNYLQANAGKHHLSGNDIREMTISSAYLSPSTGWYHVYYTQLYQSIEVYNGILNAVLVKDKVEHVGNNFVEDIAAKVPSGITGFQQSSLNAISKAASYLGLTHNPVNTLEKTVTRLANGQVSKAVYSNTTLSDEAIPVKLYWFSHTDSVSSATSLHLVWNVEIYTKDRKNYWVTQVDAYSGEVLAVDDQVIKCTFGTPQGHHHSHLQNATSDAPVINPSPLNPLAPNSYNVFDYPVESPIHGSQTIVTNPYTKFIPAGTGPGATNGWHFDGTTDYTNTRGNNVWAKEDVAHDNELTIGTSPTSATLDFNYPYTHGLNTAVGNRNAAITNLFYWNNLIHDVLWKYGFDEPSGNFQKDNMSKGGLGNDFVLADAQDGLRLDNASFFTPTDGDNPRMQMYLWSPSSVFQPDADFDNGVISHEYGHGWSTRLTGGPAINSCLQNLEQGGEGWSDYLALMLTTDWPTLTPSVASANIPREMGTYVSGQPTTGEGIRSYPYSYDMVNVNSRYTYARIAEWSVPHPTGSVWAAMLWDMTWEIIFHDNQIVNDIYNTTDVVGNVAALKLVNEGLRLQKCSPSFVDARNAILKADSLLFNSRYRCAIWNAFARRGLGVNASSGNSSNDRTIKVDFTPMTNNGWALSSPTEAVVCSHSVFNYTATATGAGTPTFGWARATVAGISNASKSGNTATISEILINTTNNPIEVTYKFYLSPSSCQIPLELKVVVDPAPLTSVASYQICKDGTVPAGQGLVAINQAYTNTVSGVLTIDSPVYNRGVGDSVTVYLFGPENGMYYKTHAFVPATTGRVSIETIAGTLSGGNPYDTYLTLYETSFDPNDPATNFLMGDDESGTLPHASKLTYDVVAGTTYILVVTTYDTGMTGTYQLQATANIFGAPNSWYATDTDVVPLATDNLFNPVGVAGSGIVNTATPLSKTFYVGSAIHNCRATATFTINSPSGGGSIAGSTTACADLNKGELTLSGYSSSIVRWESSTNNFSSVTQLADTSATIIYKNLTQTTQYRAVVKNGTCNAVNSAIATITRTNPVLPTIADYAVCQHSTLIIGAGSGFTVPFNSYGNTLSGTLFEDSPVYTRGLGNNVTIYAAAGLGGESVHYRAHTFVAPANEAVSIETIGGTLNGQWPHDTYLTLYQTSFNPEKPAINFLIGDDNSGVLPSASKITYNLVAGTTYILVVSTYSNGMTGGYEVQATANIFSGNTIKWYNYSTGGAEIATGNLFNPIGVSETGIPNTYSAISRTFFVETPDSPACRVPVTFATHQTPVGGNTAGSATVCSPTNSGTFTLSGYEGIIAQWESSTDNFTTTTVIANTTTTLNYSNVTQTTQFRAKIVSGVCPTAYSNKSVIVKPNIPAITTDYGICKDGTVPVGQGLLNNTPGYTNTVSGTFVAGSPTYWRGWGENYRYYLPSGEGGNSVYYQTHTFKPTSTGVVTIETSGGTLDGGWPYDTYIALYEGSFDPGSPAINFIIGNDEGGTLQYGSKITDTLKAGTTYILVVSGFENNRVGTYEMQATANIFGNPVYWYSSSSGGTILGTGNIFNPVGVAGSGISNTASPITKTFHTGYPAFGTCLAPATFTIAPTTVGGGVAGSNTFCSATNAGTLTLSGHTGSVLRWESSTNNFATNTPIVNTNPTLNYTNLTQRTQYRAVLKSGACETLNSALATIQTATLNTLTGSARCSPGTSVLTATGCTGGTVNWYAGISGGAAIATGTSYTIPSVSTTTTYYANCILGACVPARTPVVAAIGTTNATYSSTQTIGNYHVSQTITSSANVATGVNYFAGKAIILTPGFQAGGSEVFSARIQNCL